MNKAELVDALAQKCGLTNKVAKDIVDTLFSTETGILAKELKRREKIQITGFGSFGADHRPAREWRIPGTDRTKKVEAHYYPKFRAGKALKDFVK